MTFNDFLKTHKVNGYVLSDVKHHYLSDEEIKLLSDVWNAAINAVIYELGDQAYRDNFAYKSGDPEYAEDVAKKLLTS